MKILKTYFFGAVSGFGLGVIFKLVSSKEVCDSSRFYFITPAMNSINKR